MCYRAEKTAEAEEAIQEATRKRNELLVREDAARVSASEAADAIKEAQVRRMWVEMPPYVSKPERWCW